MKDYIKEFSIIHRGVITAGSKHIEEKCISPRFLPYIYLINSKPGISQEEISNELKIDKSTVARTVKLFLRDGFIERKQNSDDKRQYMLYPGEQMKKMHEQIEKKRESIAEIMTLGIKEEDLAVFEKVLNQMKDNVIENMKREEGNR